MNTQIPNAAPVRTNGAILHFEKMDRYFLELARRLGAEEFQFPALVSKALLERAEYPQAFPHLLLGACGCSEPATELTSLFSPGNLAAPEWYLSPAVCYHVYAHFAQETLSSPKVVTARGRCFRKEETFTPGRRQLEFEMREIVLLGEPEWLDRALAPVRVEIDAIASTFDLPVKWETAEDPFFLPTAKGKALMQRLMETKQELICEAPAPLAIASINRHGSFFGERFSIRTREGKPIHTACVAFGLDRWAALEASLPL
jgi:seryl-tRNA synthetase